MIRCPVRGKEGGKDGREEVEQRRGMGKGGGGGTWMGKGKGR